MFSFSDPDCFKLVDKTQVSTDLEPGGAEIEFSNM